MDPMISGVLDILQENHHHTPKEDKHQIHLRMFLTSNVIEHFGESLINFMDLYFELIIQCLIYGQISEAELLANQLLKDMEHIPDDSFLLLDTMMSDIYFFSIDYEDEFITSKQKLNKLINLTFGITYLNMNNESKFLNYMDSIYPDEELQRKILRVAFLNRIGNYEKAYEIVKELVHVEDFYKYVDEYCKTMIGSDRVEELFQVLQSIVIVKTQSNNNAARFVEENFGVIYCLYLSASLLKKSEELEFLNDYCVNSAPSFGGKIPLLKCHKKFQVGMTYGFLEQMKQRSSFVLLNSYTLSFYDSRNNFMQPSKYQSKVIYDNHLKLNVNMYSTTSFCFRVDFDLSDLASKGTVGAEFKYSYNPKNLSLIYDSQNEPEREIYSDSTTKVFANGDSIYICQPEGCWSRVMVTDYGSEIICYKNHLLMKKEGSIKSVSFTDRKEKKLVLKNFHRRLRVLNDTESWICFLFDVEEKKLIALGQNCELGTVASSINSVPTIIFNNIEGGIACYTIIENLSQTSSNICKYFINVENGNLHQKQVLISIENRISFDFYHEKENIIGYSTSQNYDIFNIHTGKLLYQMPSDSFYFLDCFQNMVLLANSNENRLMVFDLSRDSVKVLVETSLENGPSVVLGKFCGSHSFIIEKEDTILYEYSLSNGECIAIYPSKMGFTSSIEYFEHSPSQKRFLFILDLDCIQLIELST